MDSAEDFIVDGIAAFDAPRLSRDAGQCAVRLLFRVGAHDENLASSGTASVLVRLITSSLPFEHRELVRSSSDGLFSWFDIHATEPRLEPTLHALAAAITAPHWDLLEEQMALLQAEESMTTADMQAHLWQRRFGTAGPGVAALQKTAFRTSRRAHLETALRRSFTRDNAALVGRRDVLAGMSISLPGGVACRTLPPLRPIVTTPAAIQSDDREVVAFQLATDDGVHGRLLFAILAELLERRLTKFERLTPHLELVCNPTGPKHSTLTGVFPVISGQAVAAVNALRQTLDDAASGLLSADVYNSTRAEMLETLTQFPSDDYDAMSRARARLLDNFESLQTQRDRLAVLTPQDAGPVVTQIAASLLIEAPPNAVDAVADLPTAEPFPAPAATGETFVPVQFSARRRADIRLVIGEHGVTHTTPEAIVTVRYDDCTALLDNGLFLVLVAQSGAHVRIDPVLWRNGDDAVAIIRRQAPEGVRIVSMPTADERLEQRERRNSVRLFGTGSDAFGATAGLLLLAALPIYGIVLATMTGTRERGNGRLVLLVTAIVYGLRWGNRMPLSAQRAVRRVAPALETFQWVAATSVLVGILDLLATVSAWYTFKAHQPAATTILILFALVPIVTAVVAVRIVDAPRTAERIIHVCRMVAISTACQTAVGFVVFLASTHHLL